MSFSGPSGKPPLSGGRLGSPFGSAASLAASASGSSGAGVPATYAYAYPRTPESGLAGGAARPRSARSTHSESATTPTPSEDALSVSLSLASGATSFCSAADAHLFAPASTEDAVHAVPSLLSLLLSGRTDEQVLAARKLHAYCRHSGQPVEAAIAAAGGVHMLLIMLDSLDRNLRDLCTRVLTDLAADERVRAEILAAPGGTAKVIQLMYRGILDGQASAGRFLELLAGSKDEAVQAALCHGKVVRMLCKTLGAAPTPRARGAALSALQAFCRQDAANLRKLVWSGGCDALLGVLQPGDATPAQQAMALELLSAAVALQPDAVGGLSSPEAVAGLARFVGAPEVAVGVQADAADLLSQVAAVPVKRQGVRQALTDEVLPRAFEILHEAAAASSGSASAVEESAAEGEGGTAAGEGTAALAAAGDGPSSSGGGELAIAIASSAGGGAGAAGLSAAAAAQQRRLQASAAAIVAQLVQQDRECCHSILFHAQLLGPAVQMLVGGGRFAAAQQLLAAARAYASSLAPSSTGSNGNGSSEAAVVAAAAPA